MNDGPAVSVVYDTIEDARSEDSIVDAIGIWVLAGKSIEEWLNTIESKLSIVMNQGV